MTPAQAKAKYEAEWPALNAAKENAVSRKEKKQRRQALSALSKRCSARFELNKVVNPIEKSILEDLDQHKQAEIADLRKALTKAERLQRAPDCKWTRDASEGMDEWDSACGESWSFIYGGPKENSMRFCHGCGGRVKL